MNPAEALIRLRLATPQRKFSNLEAPCSEALASFSLSAVLLGATPVLTGTMLWRGDSRLGSYSMVCTGGTWNESGTYGYDGRGRLLSEPWNPSGGSSSNYAYQFDNPSFNGNNESGPGIRTQATLDANDFVQTTPSGTFAWITQDQVAQAASGTAAISPGYDAWGNVTSRSIVTNSGTQNQTLAWDSFNRLVGVSGSNAYAWSAVYDGLGRRIQTGFAPSGSGTTTINSYYDPQVEFMELGVQLATTSGTTRTWKAYGPDLNGRYGGLQGIGGLEATIDEGTGSVVPVVNDMFGNAAGVVSGGTAVWNSSEVNGYGMVSGTGALTLNATTPLPKAVLWHGKWIDPTGFYYMGARYYEPSSGRFLSPDPLGHAVSMSLYDYANGDPVNSVDPTARCSTLSLNDKHDTLGINTGFAADFPTTEALNKADLQEAEEQAMLQMVTATYVVPEHINYTDVTGRWHTVYDTGYTPDPASVLGTTEGTVEELWGNGDKAKALGFGVFMTGMVAVDICLNPLNRLVPGSSAAEREIEYGALDALGRPTGVYATITKDMLDTGSEAMGSITPPGWSGNGTLFNEARGHLLANELGGSGSIAENLVTLQQNFTNRTMEIYENMVYKAVEGGQTVNYLVAPVYKGNTLIPTGVTIMAEGSERFSLHLSILNPIGR